MLGVLKVKLHRAEKNMPNHLWKEFKQKNGNEISCSSFFLAFSTKVISPPCTICVSWQVNLYLLS